MRTKRFYLTLAGCLVFLAGFVTISTSYAKDLTPSEVRQYIKSTYKAVKGTDAFLDGALNKAGPVGGLAWLDIFKLLITADKVAEAVQSGNYHKAIIVAGSYGAIEATLRASQVARTYSATYSMVHLAALPIELGLKSFERAAIENAWNYQMRRYFAARKMGKSPDFIMAGKSDDDVLFDDFKWIYSVGADGGRKGLPQHLPAGYTPQNVYTAAEKLYEALLRAQQFSSEREQLGGKFLASLNNSSAKSNASGLNKSDVDSELSKIVNLPVASKENIEKLKTNEKVRVQSLGEANSTNIEALGKKSSQASKDDNWKNFIDLNQQIIAIDPNNYSALVNLSYGYIKVGATDRALEYSVKALKIFRWNAAYAYVAAAYAKKDEKDKALLWLKKAYDGGYVFKTTKNIEEYFPKYLNDPKFKAITADNYALIKRCEPLFNFVNKHAAAAWVDPIVLATNPFVYEGKTVKLYLFFARMETATTAIFNSYKGPGFVYSDVPKGMYTKIQEDVLIVGRVTGTTTKYGSPIAILKYIEALKEPASGCK